MTHYMSDANTVSHFLRSHPKVTTHILEFGRELRSRAGGDGASGQGAGTP